MLLFASIGTTASTGARLMHNFRMGLPPLASESDFLPIVWTFHHPAALRDGWSFSLTLLLILLTHEAGHLVYCRHYGVRASWPYVLPAPTLSGTAGAVIRIRSRIPSRRALIEIGVAGPIAGYVVALPATIVGLLLSRASGPSTPLPLVGFHWPTTVWLLHGVLAALHPGLAPLATALPHPVLIASWVGLFVTSLNLIPAGQLDGGHILYAVSPRAHSFVTIAVPLLLLAAGITLWTGWLLWGLILLLPAMRHPRVPYFPLLPERHSRLGGVAVALFVLTLVPAPFVGTSLIDVLR